MTVFLSSSSFSCLHQTILLTTSTSSTRIPSSTHYLRQPFDKIPQRILPNTGRSDFSQAFTLLVNSGQTPNGLLLASLLKDSSYLLDIAAGEQLHARCVLSGLTLEPCVRTSLISFYATVGLLDSAIQVFDEILATKETDLPTWNAIISAYSFHCNYAKSLLLFSVMLSISNVAPNASTYAIITKACASRRDFQFGKALHAVIIKDKTADKSLKTKMFNSIISLYSKCGDLMAAGKVFDSMGASNVVSWNAVISGHEQNGQWESALALFRRMVMLTEHRMVLKPSRITFLCVINTISSVQALKLGKEVHAKIIRVGFEDEATLANSLINMYGKCSEVEKARLVFSFLTLRDIVSWNSILHVFAQSKKLADCFKLFRRMQSLRINPDIHTLTILLVAFSSNSIVLGREIHGYLLRTQVPEALKVSSYNAVITMYAKNKRIEAAKRLFNWMEARDSCSWNAMIDGYSLNGLYKEAVLHFVEMVEEGLQCDYLTFSILFTASGRLVSIGLGKQVHGYMEKYNLHCHKANASLVSSNNALVSMYSKCGNISDASGVFQMMPRRDVLSWTAMISALANHSMAYESIRIFEMMRKSGIEPNSITYLALLTACAHGGLIKEGMFYFNLMCNENEIEVGAQHYAAMVDLFGRAGQFKEAEAMVNLGTACLANSNHDTGLCLWRNFLGACHAHNQLELGIRAAKKILEIEPKDETTHVLLSNLHASCGLWEDMIAVRKLMKDKGLKKETGCSWVEIGIRKHCFVAGDACHPNRKRYMRR
ncbi:hypothetical protein M5K25_016060 [Dendrobium thyrsiflorum]|uniref:Pentatricopeptide repeat-containing protein n=1 Tax=Dendrobium thyrsiflorum TaxID=117978 RepID=A0ABD0UZZ3_DENTH